MTDMTVNTFLRPFSFFYGDPYSWLILLRDYTNA